jgi:hypothetical protein
MDIQLTQHYLLKEPSFPTALQHYLSHKSRDYMSFLLESVTSTLAERVILSYLFLIVLQGVFYSKSICLFFSSTYYLNSI